MSIMESFISALGMKMTCEECDKMIVDSLDGALTFWKRASYKIHLLACKHCREFVDGYVSTVEMASHAYDDAAESDIPEALVQTILRASGSKQ